MTESTTIYLARFNGDIQSSAFSTEKQAHDAIEHLVKNHYGKNTKITWHSPSYASWIYTDGVAVKLTLTAHIIQYPYYEKGIC